MAKPQEKLAGALEALNALQNKGVVAIRAAHIKRATRELLLRHGFLREVMKGWYIAARPDEGAGESTAWYASFWPFCAAYLRERFGSDWCLSPEHSLSLHAGNRAVPPQLLVRTPRGGNKATGLPYGTSLFDVRAALPADNDIEEKDGLRLFSLPAALIASAPGFFERGPTDVRGALFAIDDASELVRRLLEGGHSTIAGRLAGAFRNLGRDRVADDILSAMRAAGHIVREQDPFAKKLDIVPRHEPPFASRIRLMWQQMRGAVIERFPAAPGRPHDVEVYLQHVQEVYVTDAYHSLSIEGYRVSPALIERVRRGNWNPDRDEQDRGQRDALAARGYWLAHETVLESLLRVLGGENPGAVAREGHGTWYRELFAPSVAAGLSQPADLAGYRSGPVFIKRSMHVHPGRDAVRDAMPVFFEMLTEESEHSVRASVLMPCLTAINRFSASHSMPRFLGFGNGSTPTLMGSVVESRSAEGGPSSRRGRCTAIDGASPENSRPGPDSRPRPSRVRARLLPPRFQFAFKCLAMLSYPIDRFMII